MSVLYTPSLERGTIVSTHADGDGGKSRSRQGLQWMRTFPMWLKHCAVPSA